MPPEETSTDQTRKSERATDAQKKIRVLVFLPENPKKPEEEKLHECFTNDISELGFYLIIHSEALLKKFKENMFFKFFVEYKLDTMIECRGSVKRVEPPVDPDGKYGVAISITSISGPNMSLLRQMIASLSRSQNGQYLNNE